MGRNKEYRICIATDIKQEDETNEQNKGNGNRIQCNILSEIKLEISKLFLFYYVFFIHLLLLLFSLHYLFFSYPPQFFFSEMNHNKVMVSGWNH